MKASKVANVFIAGALIGSVAALFMAPFSGKKLRKVTKKKLDNAYSTAKVKFSPTVEELRKRTHKFGKEALDVTKKLTNETIQSGRNIFNKHTGTKNRTKTEDTESTPKLKLKDISNKGSKLDETQTDTNREVSFTFRQEPT